MLFFFQAEDGIRDLVRSRGLGDVYKRQAEIIKALAAAHGVKLNAAKLLFISRAQLYEKLATHGLLSEHPDRKEAV